VWEEEYVKMIKKLIDTNELMLLEIDKINICGRDICIKAIKDLPVFVPIIIVFLLEEDYEYEKLLQKIPSQYNALIFSVQGKAYAAFFPVSNSDKAYADVMAYIGQLYPDPVYAHEFRDLNELEDLIKARVIAKTEKSALYKKNNTYCYVTNSALNRLQEYFINPQPLLMDDITKHCEKIIGKDAYDKILSYVKGTDGGSN